MLQESSEKIYINSGNQDVLGLISKPASRILDVGCGNGALAQILSSLGHRVDGITISLKEYASAEKYLDAVYLHNLETGLPEKVRYNQYDYVICSHVLEHIAYPETLLDDIKVVLKSEGALIVALPNIMHYKSRLQLLAGNFEYSEAGIWDNTHLKWYTFESAKKLLLLHGFRIDYGTVTGELPFNSLFIKILPGRLRKQIFSMLLKISKGLFGYQLLFKAHKDNRA